MRLLLLVLLVGAALLLLTAQPGGHNPPVAGHLRVAIDAAAAGADFSRTAGRNRYVILQAWETDRRAALKAADPDVRLLAYANLSAMMDPDESGRASTGLTTRDAEAHPDWFLLDTAGARFNFRSYEWLWAADIGRPSYQQAWADAVLARLRDGGWDGVFADDVNPTIGHHFEPSWVARYPDDASYAAATGAALAQIGPRITDAGKLFVANFGAWSAHRRVDGWLEHVSGAMEESFAKAGPEEGTGYVTGEQWERQVEAIEAAEARGRAFLGVAESTATDAAAARYGWATMLLAARGGAAFALHADYTHETWFPEYDLDLGAPEGDRVRDPSLVHRRRFANGLVLVNPTEAPVPVEFGGRYSGSGLSPTTRATMGPHTGLVLVKSG